MERVFNAYRKYKDITKSDLLLTFSILPVKLFFETICLWARSSGGCNDTVAKKRD